MSLQISIQGSSYIYNNVRNGLKVNDIPSEFDENKQILYIPIGKITNTYDEFIQLNDSSRLYDNSNNMYVSHGFIYFKYIHIDPPIKKFTDVTAKNIRLDGMTVCDDILDYIMHFYHDRMEIMNRKNFTKRKPPSNFKPAHPPDISKPIDVTGLEWLVPNYL